MFRVLTHRAATVNNKRFIFKEQKCNDFKSTTLLRLYIENFVHFVLLRSLLRFGNVKNYHHNILLFSDDNEGQLPLNH